MLFLVTAVMGKLMLTSQWTDSVCGAAPDVMYLFDMVNDSARNGTQKEVWPLMYQVQATRMPYSQHCMSSLKVPVPDMCCIEHLYPEKSSGFLSGGTISVGSTVLDSAPVSANGNSYCHVKPATNGSALGFQGIYYHANDKCIKTDGIVCSSTGLKLYQNRDCTGEVLAISLGQVATLQNERFGNITAEMVTVNSAKTTFMWTALIPINDFTIDYRFTHDIVQVALYGISILAFTVVLGYQLTIFFKRKTWYVISLLASQVVWLGFVIVRLYCTVGQFTELWDGALFTLLNLASLSSVLISASFLMKFAHANKWVQIGTFTTIAIIHIILTGNNYVRYNRNAFAQLNKVSMLDPKTLHPIWISFTFAFDCVPPVYVLFSLLRVNTRSVANRFRMLWHSDAIFCITFVLQLLNVGLYLGIDRMRNASVILGSDRAWLSMNGFICCSLAIHALLNYVLIERMANLVKSGTLFHSSTMSIGGKTESQMQSTMSRKDYV